MFNILSKMYWVFDSITSHIFELNSIKYLAIFAINITLNNNFTYSWFSTTHIPIWYAQKYPNTNELYKDGYTWLHMGHMRQGNNIHPRARLNMVNTFEGTRIFKYSIESYFLLRTLYFNSCPGCKVTLLNADKLFTKSKMSNSFHFF